MSEEEGMFASSNFDKPTQPPVPTRVVGAILLVVGLLLAWWQILGPLQAAHRHEPKIEYESRAQFIALFCTFGSIPLLIFGNKIPLNRQQTNRYTWKHVLGGLAMAGVMILFDQWLKGEFAKLGYATH